jgi:sterol desaturase/sphingolipid hydroxylase (fatty acid hydroxylase superfamily)
MVRCGAMLGIWDPMKELMYTYLGVVLLQQFVTLIACAKQYRKRVGVRASSNLGVLVLWMAVAPTVMRLLPVEAYAGAHPLWARPDWMRSGWFVLVDIACIDLFMWAYHIVAHKNKWLWRLHSVHHFDERLDTSTALRFHPIEFVLVMCVRSVFYMIWAVPFQTIVLWRVVLFAFSIWGHLEWVRFPKWFEDTFGKVFVLPAFHVVHHTSRLPYTDTNFGTVFSIWDRIAGTTLLDKPRPDMKRGVDDHEEPGLIGTLVQPFTTIPDGK